MSSGLPYFFKVSEAAVGAGADVSKILRPPKGYEWEIVRIAAYHDSAAAKTLTWRVYSQGELVGDFGSASVNPGAYFQPFSTNYFHTPDMSGLLLYYETYLKCTCAGSDDTKHIFIVGQLIQRPENIFIKEHHGR